MSAHAKSTGHLNYIATPDKEAIKQIQKKIECEITNSVCFCSFGELPFGAFFCKHFLYLSATSYLCFGPSSTVPVSL